MKDLKIGILGASQIVQRSICYPVNNLSYAQITGLASKDLHRASRICEKYGISKPFGNYEQLIADNETNVIYIATANNFHSELIQTSLQHGKHVLVEKPICIAVNDFHKIEREYRASGKHLLEAIMVQHHPWQQALRDIIQQKTYGALKTVETTINFELHDIEDNYRNDPSKGGGIFHDVGIYWLQFIQKCIGPLDSISYDCKSSFDGTNNVDLDFDAEVMLKNNIRCSFTGSFRKRYLVYHKLEFNEATLIVDDFFRPLSGMQRIYFKINQTKSGELKRLWFEKANYYQNQLEYLHALINDKVVLIDTIHQSRERIELLNNIYQKALEKNKNRIAQKVKSQDHV